MQKKACIITTAHPVFDIRIFHKQAKTLVNAGYNVILIANHEKNETVENIKIIVLPKSKNRFNRMILNTFIALFLALKQKADIYHFHDPEFLMTGVLLKIITGKPVIYDCHEYYEKAVLYKKWIPEIFKKPYSLFIKTYEKILYPFMDAVIGVLDKQAEKFPNTKFVTLHNYPVKSYFDEHNNDSAKEFDLIYAGSLSKERGLFLMLTIINELKNSKKDVKLILVGKFADSITEREFYDFIKLNSLTENIFFLGFKTQKETIDLLKKAKIGLWLGLKTEQYNGPQLATKIFEYMAAGIPCISTNFEYTATHIGNKNFIYFVEPDDYKSIINKINYLLDNKELYNSLGKQALDSFNADFNWEKEQTKLLKLYEELI